MKQREQAAREATAMVYGTPGYATMTQPEKDKVNEAVLKKVALKYDVYPEMVAEAVVETLQADEEAEKVEEAYQVRLKYSWTARMHDKWIHLPGWQQVVLLWAFMWVPYLGILGMIGLMLMAYRFVVNAPEDHWVHWIARIGVAGIVYGEYKKFRDGPKK